MKLLIIWILGLSSVLANEFSKANNLFTVTAYNQILKHFRGNFVVSPFSAETVLAFAQSGCRGETAEEIRNVLHLPNDTAKIDNDVKNALSALNKSDKYSLYIANKIYVKKGYPIKPEFQKVASEIYRAESENIDFWLQGKATSVMNAWVEQKTNNKIHNLINPYTLSSDSRVILLNALYFKGDWSHQFPISDTKKRKFYKTAQDYVEVDMMRYKSSENDWNTRFDYYESPHLDAQLIELPYKGEDVSMTVVLPKQKDGIAKLENQLDRVFSTTNFKREPVDLQFPKFKMESTIDFMIILQNLGVTKIFDNISGDLSGIAGKKGDLAIDKIIQKIFIDVGEEGVEAAAATFTHESLTLEREIKPKPKSFIADHPFLFYIKVKGIIVFAGKVTDPTL